jgi:hypothetical protein
MCVLENVQVEEKNLSNKTKTAEKSEKQKIKESNLQKCMIISIPSECVCACLSVCGSYKKGN